MDEDTIATIRARIAELQAEMKQVAEQAAQQAIAPYLAAIGELQRLLPPEE